MQPQHSLLRPLAVHLRWGGGCLHDVLLLLGEGCMELEVGVGSGMENTLWVSLGSASLTNSSSFTMHRLKEKWALRQLMDGHPHPQY